MYIKINKDKTTEFPYTLDNLRKDNPQKSFPDNIDDKTLESYSVYKVVATPTPAFDPNTTQLILGVELESEVWKQSWKIEKLPQEQAEENIRKIRNQLLLSCDWTQLIDSPLSLDSKTEWTTYREALRDIPNQKNFPWEVSWPEQPK